MMIKKEKSEGLCLEPDIIITIKLRADFVILIGRKETQRDRGLSQEHRG